MRKSKSTSLLWLAYYPVYLFLFIALEEVRRREFVLTTWIDKEIPLIPVFVVPYLLWFPFIAIVFVVFFLRSGEEFKKYAIKLYIGMTVFLVISFVFPNRLTLRPMNLGDTTIFERLLRLIYRNDTASNVFPSIHVYNSVISAMEIVRSKVSFTGKRCKAGCCILAVLISLSTVFIKQHSVLDVAGAIILVVIVDLVVDQIREHRTIGDVKAVR